MDNEYTEVFESSFGIEEDDKDRMELVGLVQKADYVNKNGRFYPREVLSAAVNRFKQKFKRSFSQLDHPDMKGKLRDTSHLIKDLYWDDNDLYAKITVLDTPAGKTLREIIRAGGRPGLSTRGNGHGVKVSMDGREVEKISSGFDLTGIDFVTSPSVEGTGVKQVIRESHEDQTLIRIRERMQKLAGIPITECRDCTYEEDDGYRCTCVDCGFTFTSRWERCEDRNCPKCQGSLKSATAAAKPQRDAEQQKEYTCECFKCGHTQKSDGHCRDIECEECGGAMRRVERPGPGQPPPSMKPKEVYEQDARDLLRDIARLQEMDVDEEFGIDWTEKDPHIMLDNIACLTDTEEELDEARESFHDNEHESTDIEAIYRKAQSFAEIERSSPREDRDSITERVHLKLQTHAGLDTRYFKESTKESQALERRLKRTIQEKRSNSVATFIKIMEWAKK